jgi:hypothetical protein
MDNPSLPAWRAALTLAFSESGDEERARADLLDLVKDRFAQIPRDMFWLAAMCALAETAAELAETRPMPELIAALEPYANYNAQIGWAAVLGPVSGFVGRLDAALGNHAAAEREFRLALRQCEILGARPAKARIQWALAESLLARGADPVQGRELLEQSQAATRSLGMASLELRVADALTALEPV